MQTGTLPGSDKYCENVTNVSSNQLFRDERCIL